MMKHGDAREHLRQKAYRHEEAHERLKQLLKRTPLPPKTAPLFWAVLAITVLLAYAWMQWRPAVKPELKPAAETVLSQAPRGPYPAIWLSTAIGKGQHLTRVPQNQLQAYQKSVLGAYYLGQKTGDLKSTLHRDTDLLRQMQNALEVDLFAILNRGTDRSERLDAYLRILSELRRKAQARSGELASTIAFLESGAKSKASGASQTEEAFFESLKSLNGLQAQEELGNFIGLRESEVDARAKKGAYEGLKRYYDFYLPRLDNLIRAVQSNRDALIAGVKVVEIENMTLPLIIKGQ